jgi:hypothetical protein
VKLNRHSWLTPNACETIATFGDARLVKQLNGKIELHGGSPENRTEAKEWVSLFLHEAVISSVPARPACSRPIERHGGS